MNFFKGLAGKLSILAGVPLLGLIVVSYCSIQSVGTLDEIIKGLGEKRLPITRMIGDLRAEMNIVARSVWQDIAVTDAAQREKMKSEVNSQIQQVENTISEMDKIGLVPKNKENLARFKEIWVSLKGKYSAVLEKLETSKNEAESIRLMSETIPQTESMSVILTDMGKVMLAANLKSREDAKVVSEQVNILTLSLAIILTILVVICVALLGR
ncbi:MAG TPA: MCP four helix bundle domain-containing protein, partial [Bdellovibrio sp.]|nr:MCP four helix bundle domain-containing protein [Bdellovibrio sp.]